MLICYKMQDRNLLPFPKEGLKLSFILNHFYDFCGGRSGLAGKTTSQVNEEFQKKITAVSRLSFCEYLKSNGHHRSAVGVATVFISHAWSYEFLEIMDALENNFKSEPNVIIWFDVFSVNQHTDVVDFGWWCSAFKTAIRDFGRTVMVLAPWYDPIPLKRGWCLFELYCTIVTNSKFEVAMSKANTSAFLKDISRTPLESINRMLATIDVEKSECSKPEDKKRIFEIVLKEVRVSQINSMIFERMRAWVIDSAEAARVADAHDLSMLDAVASLYQQMGKYEKAEPLYADCLEKRTATLGDSHPLTLTSMNNLATILKVRRAYSTAEPLFVECLEKRRSVIGRWHPDTLLSMNNLANLYYNQGEHQKAEPLYLSCLENRRVILGEAHPSTLESLNNSAALYDTQGRYDMAEPLYVECMATRKRKLGESHPDTLLSMHNLAILYKNKGDHSKAESMFLHCLEKRTTVLGANHPDTEITRSEILSINNGNNNNAVNSTLVTSNTAPPQSNDCFPIYGIKLSYLLHEFQDLCGGRKELEGKTTTDVTIQFVKAITSSSKLSFVDYLKNQNHSAVGGTATVFISHAWKYLFLEVMDALQNHFKHEPDILISFDSFCVNQHMARDLDFEWWCKSFKSAVTDFGRTVMVLAPWNDPVPFQRGWVVLELYCTIIANNKFQVALTQSALEKFITDVSESPIESINRMLATIDLLRAECLVPGDRERILDVIRRDIGIDQLNSVVFDRMRAWVIDSAEAALAENKNNLNLLNAVASLYQHQGKYDQALPLYTNCLAKRKAALGDSHPLTLSSINNLATLYRHLGRLGEAEIMYWDCVDRQLHELGDSHPDTIATMYNLAILYYTQGKLKRAEPILEECLEKRRIILGDSHPDTLTSMYGLATLYNSMGKYDQAKPLFVKCLECRHTTLGESHPDTLIAMHHLAVLLDNQENFEQAESFYMECLQRRTILLSWDHPETVSTRNDLMSLYRQRQSQHRLRGTTAIPLEEPIGHLYSSKKKCVVM